MNHLTPEQLIAYRAGKMFADERQQAVAHLADCDTCFANLKTVTVPTQFIVAKEQDAEEFAEVDEHLALDEIIAHIDGKATPVLKDFVAAHVDTCAFCRVRVDNLRSFKAEVEAIEVFSPVSEAVASLGEAASQETFGLSALAVSWRTRLSAFRAALKTPQVQTRWFVATTVTGAAAALWILRPHSDPNIGNTPPDVTATQRPKPLPPVVPGARKILKTPRRDGAATPEANAHLANGNASEPKREMKYHNRDVVTKHKPVHKAVNQGANTNRQEIVKTPPPAPDNRPVPLETAVPAPPPSVHSSQPLQSSSQPVVPSTRPLLLTPQRVLPLPPAPRQSPQLASPFAPTPGKQQQNIQPSSQPVQPLLRLPKSTPQIAMPSSKSPMPTPKPVPPTPQPTPPSLPKEPPPQIAVAPPKHEMPPPQVAVAPPQRNIDRNQPSELYNVRTRMGGIAPCFAEDLTRASLGAVAGVEDQNAPEARMTPGRSGHMVVMGANTDVWCPPGQFVELLPNLQVEGFRPVSVAVWEDGVRTQAHGLDETYTLRVTSPLGGINRKRVNVVLYDALGHAQPVMQCTIRARVASLTVVAPSLSQRNEPCSFHISNSQDFTNISMYLGDIYLGQMKEGTGAFRVDERLLPPGSYSCQIVGKNVDGIYVPGASSEFTVPNRYTIECGSNPTNIVIGEHSDEKLMVRISHAPGLNIVKTRVYVAGFLTGEKAGDSFVMALPTRNVPTGRSFIEVIGVGEDGVTYPVESLAINVKNEPWEQRLYHTPEYERIAENKAQIAKLWQDVCTNLERARYEPSIYNDSTTFTLFSITEHYTVGKSAEFQAAAKTAFIQMTQLQLKTAKLYRKLDMRSHAMTLFHRVWRELSSSTADGEDAKRSLEAMRKLIAVAQ